YGVEHWREVAGRGIDNAEHLGDRRLTGECLVPVAPEISDDPLGVVWRVVGHQVVAATVVDRVRSYVDQCASTTTSGQATSAADRE
ncbi:MAG TPA: hypothetical protein VEN78_32600, partial [Bradyrhizobium sp.]|nr:hypothetical protein [Bradyrhizobium sp.]